jgi:hypothetical protein
MENKFFPTGLPPLQITYGKQITYEKENLEEFNIICI